MGEINDPRRGKWRNTLIQPVIPPKGYRLLLRGETTGIGDIYRKPTGGWEMEEPNLTVSMDFWPVARKTDAAIRAEAKGEKEQGRAW